MATLKEIARRAEVSASAVSAVVNGTTHTRMSAQTRARIEAVIAEVGYVPNDAARALRRQQAGTIAVVVEGLENPVYKELLLGIYEAAEARGWAVVLGDTAWMRSGSPFLARLLGQGSIDAILLRHEGLIDGDVLAHLRARPTPVVLLEQQSDPHSHWVAVDDLMAGRMATEFLLQAGHTDVRFVGGLDESRTSAARYDGYVTAMKQARRRPRAGSFTGFGVEAGSLGFAAIRSSGTFPTGVVVNNVMSAAGLLAAAADHGVEVPGQLSVVGIHDAEIADIVRPRLTTVRLPMRALGVRAVDQVAALLEGTPTTLGVIESRPQIIVRASTAPPSR
ncbi:LacI family DNA-binding transcriptional regulator [Occultella gossypii]|uniref:LacI family DNA-binding transcriptional regulator n=1 Tax=Occultella gossypii TaxID=2800820 RepID=A0ABS7S523_9MICO|nr:LacI family DNA-binding transcriptional regulator [Occultella gossypii]MBZ2195420.1 LacI family DNA-binding transcriptional regulator [Occultella gossypii]